MPSQSVEEYLEAIYRIGGETGTVNTCELATMLGVAPPSVTTMLARLTRDGLVEHTRYKGIKLTQSGREMAASMIRRHRLSERLLTDVLGMPWHRVHEAACKLEHVMTGEIEERTYKALGEPERCPHGQMLKGDDDESLVALSSVEPGSKVRVVKLAEEKEEFLIAVEKLGLIPSAEVTISSIIDSEICYSIAGNEHQISIDLAGLIWVCPVEPK
ncbi:MAG: metal-dependent transcriptional regulator [Armatimonadota bacterium]